MHDTSSYSLFGRVVCVAVALLTACAAPDPSAQGWLAEESPGARSAVEAVRRFHVAGAEHERAASDPLLGPPEVARMELVGVRVVPRLAASLGAPRARVELPRFANEAFHVRDEASGVSIDVRLRDARNAPIELAGGYAVYLRGHAGRADVIHRVTARGTEDFVAFDVAPERPVVRYAMALGASAAGLRLVSNTLEVLDVLGAPRLRVAPPFVVDREGARHAATIAIEGCAVDESPASPWDRSPTAPGARECTVRVAWDGAPVAYPAVLDPSWTITDAPTERRFEHTASLLASGRVLVVGGQATASAELYDPATETWAATGSLATSRYWHSASVLRDGRVLVAGGERRVGAGMVIFFEALASAELYDPALGTWSDAASMADARFRHTASVLNDGRVLVAGESTDGSAELYDPVEATWSETDAMVTARRYHTASVLEDGRVLVTGGSHLNVPLASAELYDPAMETWRETESMAAARGNGHTASVLDDGRVLVVGGYAADWLASAETFAPGAEEWGTGSSLNTARARHTATVLADGRVLVAGGETEGSVAIATTEMFSISRRGWAVTEDMRGARYGHTATLLPDRRVLAVGEVAAATAELYEIEGPLGVACAHGTGCASGHCVDGVCCDTACNRGCEVCSVAAGALDDGACAVVTDTARVCRSGSGDVCDPSETCDGVTASCPADLTAFDGTPCPVGVCSDGACALPVDAGVDPSDAGLDPRGDAGPPGPDAAHDAGGPPADEGGCTCGAARRSSRGIATSVAALALAAVALRRARRKIAFAPRSQGSRPNPAND